MKTLIIIPSRLSATRLPGNPLLKINGLSMISLVFKKAEEANIGEVVVATEDQEIIDDVKKNGGQAIITKNQHKTGTDRVYEALQKLNHSKFDLVMNLQGDEPLMDINDIKNLNQKMIKNNSKIGTLASKILDKKTYVNQNVVKAITRENLNNINVTELGTNFGSNYLSMNPLNQVVDTADKLTLEDIKNKTSGFVSELIGINPAGASDLDIASGAAVLSVNDDGGLEFKVNDPFAKWDNVNGQKVSKEFKAPTPTADGYYTVKDTEGNVLDTIVIDNYTNFVN